MVNELKTDLRRALTGPSFWMAAAAMAAAIFLGAGMEALLPKGATEGLIPGYHADFIWAALRSDAVLMALPILCTLPYTAAFLDEYDSGFIKPYLMKCNQARYVRGKVIAPALSGGLCLAVGVVMAFVAAWLIYTPMELAGETMPPWGELIRQCLLFFACGALWASVGTLLSNVSMSKYMAYASPFVIFYVLVMLSERYFRDLYVLSPKQWILMDSAWPLGTTGVIVLVSLLTLIFGMANGAVIEKRIKN